MKTLFTKILPLFCITTLVSTSFLHADSSLAMTSPKDPAHTFHQYKNGYAFAAILEDRTIQCWGDENWGGNTPNLPEGKKVKWITGMDD
ncbi:MAG: hypothetical protein QE493_04750 [Verrucomicrobiae bacterium]|jgi:hypothetical protein|nr:hypothetical protein [Verrucomicrobiae bacterium]